MLKRGFSFYFSSASFLGEEKGSFKHMGHKYTRNHEVKNVRGTVKQENWEKYEMRSEMQVGSKMK